MSQMLGRGVANSHCWGNGWGEKWKEPWWPEQFGLLKERGFSSYRIPASFSLFCEGGPNYMIDPAFIADVTAAVDAVLDAGMVAIIDYHDMDFSGSPSDSHRQMWLKQWEQVAQHFKDYPSTVLFELLNEPHGSFNEDILNRWYAEVIPIIRRTNPTRTIVYGGHTYNDIHRLRELDNPPAGDKNVIGTFHFYCCPPQIINWCAAGTTWDPKAHGDLMIDKFEKHVDAFIEEHPDIPIWMGEAGAYTCMAEESRIAWSRFLFHDLLESRCIPWNTWGWNIKRPIAEYSGGDEIKWNGVGDAICPADEPFPQNCPNQVNVIAGSRTSLCPRFAGAFLPASSVPAGKVYRAVDMRGREVGRWSRQSAASRTLPAGVYLCVDSSAGAVSSGRIVVRPGAQD
jgi:endoglucanase